MTQSIGADPLGWGRKLSNKKGLLMRQALTTGLLAGVIAAVIWMSIGLWVGLQPETVGIWALVFLVGTAVLTMVGTAIGSKSSSIGTPAATRD